MDWKEADERLIRRGELILDPKFLENPGQELKTMNKHKRGRNYHIANTYIQLLAAVRYLYSMPYRQLEGFTRALHRLVPTTPPRADYSGIRKTHPTPTRRPLPEPQGDERARLHRRRLHRHQGPEGRRLDREEAREEEAVREAPLRRQHRDPRGGRHGGLHGRCARREGAARAGGGGGGERAGGQAHTGMAPTTRGTCTGSWRRGVSSPSSSLGGTAGWIRGLRGGGWLWVGSGSWGMRRGPGSRVMGGGGLWRRLTRRLSGCSGSTAWPGALRTSRGSWRVRWLCIICW